MNRKDKENINELRQMVSDLKQDLTDFDLLRWLNHYSNNFDAIVPKLRRNISVTNCCLSDQSFKMPDIMRRYYPTGITGFSKSNEMLVFILCFGRLDSQGIQHTVNCTNFLWSVFSDHLSYFAEIRAREKLIQKQVKIAMVLDCDRLQVDWQFFRFLTTSYKITTEFFTENYGGFYGKYIVVNAPYNVAYVWKLVKAVIPGKAAEKVVILGNNWKTEILQYIDADALPKHWGGTMVDDNGDEMCRSMIVVPEKIPEHLYYQLTPEDLAIEDKVCLKVKPGKAKFVTIRVEKVGKTIEWYFRVEGGYGFGVYYCGDDEKSKNVDSMEMVFPDFAFFPLGALAPERGKIVCNKVGYYKLRFNNKPSWIYSSTIHYKVSCY